MYKYYDQNVRLNTLNPHDYRLLPITKMHDSALAMKEIRHSQEDY